VLNLRTGGICGVLKRTRDSSQALGGYAIPIQSLFRLSPTLERLSRRFHQADRKWLDLLPPNQRALMASGRPGSGVHHPTRFFVVTVRQTGTGWMASAVEYPSGKATPALRSSSTQRPEVNVDLSSVRQSAARVFRYWGRRGRGDQRVEIELLGQILAAVLPDGIGAEFDALVANPARPIELVLRFETGRDDDLAYLPWEHLLLPHPSSSSDIYVAREDKFAFVRAIESEWRERDEQLGRGLSVLLIEVDPEPPPRHDEDRPPSCVSTVCDELEEKAEDLGIIVKRISAPTEDAIAREFAVGSYDIVHYVGFGRYLPVKPNPVDELALGGTGENAYVDPAGFRMVLAGSPPTLVVLQLCEGPKEDMPPDLSSFGPALLPPLAVYEGVEEEGTQAVIAYQFPLPRGLNVLFNGVLYEHLMAGESVQMAVQAGRRSIWRSSPNNRNCLAPATFLRRPGELAMTAGAIDSSALTRSSALTNNA
jgi:hypothetical protein